MSTQTYDGLRAALQLIAEWQSHTPEFAVDFGSNGVRDLYRQIAKVALETYPRLSPLAVEQVWSSEEIMAINGTILQLPMEELMKVVRAVEAAHGITKL